jgi:asparagine synthase (glutamine-hydrolysing)
MSDFFGVVNFDDPPDRPFIAGDIRLDDRDALVEKLGDDRSDADLVLLAYERWRDACVDHLLGDFAFAIWNGDDLFCARDHFGTKPFYYARRGDTFVFSNAIATLRKHPIVTDAIDDGAITDFLLFGWQQDRESTSYRDIRCLPAAHTLEARRMKMREYWTLPIEEPMRGDPVDGFREVLARAVRDRTPENVTVSLSGGVDSSAITALAREITSGIDAYTIAFDSLIPDDERPFATSVANHLDIGLHVIDGGAYRFFDPRITKEQPRNDPLDAISFDMHTAASRRANVMLAGQGGDAVMYASHSYFFNLLRRGRFIRFASEIGGYVLRRRHRPPLGLRSSIRRALGMRKKMETPPPWVKASDVADRWERHFGDEEETHPTRPQAYNLLRGAGWQRLSEYLDPAAMGAPVEYRNPYLDVRVVRYVLRVPPMPWFAEKELLRASMRGRLPENVRMRRKTALRVDPTHVLMTQQADELATIVQSCGELERFVDRTQAAAAIRNPRRTPFESYLLAFPIGLALWPILRTR